MIVRVVRRCLAPLLMLLAHSAGAQKIPPMRYTVDPAPYPYGDAEAVYRVVLDTVYRSLGERPPYIVVWDSASYPEGCWQPGCPILPRHASRIDSATIADFDRTTHARSPLRRDLNLSLPVTFLSDRIRNDLVELGTPISDSVLKVNRYTEAMPFWLGFRRRYPRAWGYAVLTSVGFNSAHTQALVQLRHQCGSACGHSEDLFLEKADGNWRVSERILLHPGQDNVDVVQHFYSLIGDGRDSLVFGSLRYLGPDARWLADARRRIDSVRTVIRDSVARDKLPRTIRGTVINQTTGLPVREVNVFVISPRDRSTLRLVTDSKGRFEARKFSLGGTMILVKCRASTDSLPSIKGYLGDTGLWAYGAIDTTITIRIPDLKPCWEPRKLHRLQGGWLESTEARAATYPGGDDAGVFAAVLDQFVSRTRVALLNVTRKHCMLSDPGCGGAQLARLENIGIIDSSTIHDFLINADSSTTIRPSFVLSRGHEIITHNEIRYLIGEVEAVGQGTSTLGEHDYFRRRPDDMLEYPSFWNGFHTLYGTTAKIVSLSRVGFNKSHTQALVQVLTATKGSDKPQLVLLAKKGGRWRVERRAIEREENSARLEGGRCVWKSLPARTAKPAISGFRGQFRFTQVTMSPTQKIQRFTVSLMNGPARHFVRGEIYHANGERQPELEVYVGSDTTTAFMDVRAIGAANRLLQRFRIHEIRAGNFYGSWVPPQVSNFPIDSPRGGIANSGGYFCAERVR